MMNMGFNQGFGTQQGVTGGPTFQTAANNLQANANQFRTNVMSAFGQNNPQNVSGNMYSSGYSALGGQGQFGQGQFGQGQFAQGQTGQNISGNMYSSGYSALSPGQLGQQQLGQQNVSGNMYSSGYSALNPQVGQFGQGQTGQNISGNMYSSGYSALNPQFQQGQYQQNVTGGPMFQQAANSLRSNIQPQFSNVMNDWQQSSPEFNQQGFAGPQGQANQALMQNLMQHHMQAQNRNIVPLQNQQMGMGMNPFGF